jgi:23S rRNA U2552 (ribose-2'-O)-methylase RlmE/FtsJ
MYKYLQINSDLFNRYLKIKDELGNRTDLEYLFKPLNDKRKKDFDYYNYMRKLDENELKLKNITSFLDICAAPGQYSKYIYNKTGAKGTGVTLQEDLGGLKFIEDIPNYTIKYANILKENPLDKKFNFAVTGCLDMTLNKPDKPFKDLELWLSALLMAIKHLENGGILAFKMTTKYINLFSNFVYIMSKMFEKVSTFKSSEILGYRSFCYIIGNNYKYNQEMIDFLDGIIKDYQNNDFKKIKEFKYRIIFDIEKYGEFMQKKIEKVIAKQMIAIKRLLEKN